MDYSILAYYCITDLSNPQEEVARHLEFFRTRDFKGRIYLSEQGINGQASGACADAEEYIKWMHADPRFEKMSFKTTSAKEHAFPKMTVKYRKQLVAIDCEVDFSHRGEAVSPEEWKKMLQEKDDETLLIDVRNKYEWEVGHFEGAELPNLETFREFPAYAQQLKQECDPKKTVVMMYCTGGIRCEYYSALMKKEGFEKVYQLEGGVVNYGLQEGADLWEGNLFVFDDRLVVSVGKEKAAPISECTYCKALIDVYYNCANMDCNDLFLCCPKCLKEESGCCSAKCRQEGRVRPYHADGSSKPFRKWDYQEKQAWRAEKNGTSLPS